MKRIPDAKRRCPNWVYKMQEQTRHDDDILQESEPFCDSGMMPSSVVLRRHENGFVSHVKVYPKDDYGNSSGKPYYAWGHYIRDFESAVKDYKERCENYDVDG